MADLPIGAPAIATIDAWSDRLRADGYCIIPDAIAPDCVATLNEAFDARFGATPFCDGGFYGQRTTKVVRQSPSSRCAMSTGSMSVPGRRNGLRHCLRTRR